MSDVNVFPVDDKLSPEQSVQTNPAGFITPDRDIIPMSVPLRRLEVTPIVGYHLYWMRGAPDRLLRAQRAGYVFVTPEEVNMADPGLLGNEDMGSGRVSVAAGGSADGQAVRLFLMKVKREHWLRSQELLEQRSEQTAATMRRGLVGLDTAQGASLDGSQRYVKGKVPALFQPKKGRRP